MRDKLELVEDFFAEDREMTVMEFILTVVAAFFIGMVFGMVFSPKGDTIIGSHNGNDNVGSFGADDSEYDEENNKAKA